MLGKKILVLLLMTASLCFLKIQAYALDAKDASMEEVLLAANENQTVSLKDDGFYRRELRKAITTETPEEEMPLSISSYAKYIPKSHAYGADGSVGLMDTSTELNYQFKAGGKLPVEIGFESQYVGINNSTNTKLPAHLTSLTTKVDVTLPFFFDKTYLRIGVSPGYLSDNWDAHNSSFRIPTRAFAIYQMSEQLTLMLGAAYFPRSEGNNLVPVVGLIYKPNDKLVFNLIPSQPNITYSVNDKLDVFLVGEYFSDEYVVGNNITKNDVQTAVLQYKYVSCGGGIKYSINKNIDLSLAGGSVMNRALKYRDSFGKISLRNSFYTEFRIDMAL